MNFEIGPLPIRGGSKRPNHGGSGEGEDFAGKKQRLERTFERYWGIVKDLGQS